jgi:hypothetical protein
VRKTQYRSVVPCVGGDVSAGLICNNITYLYIASRNYAAVPRFFFEVQICLSCWLTAINKLFLNAITVSWCIVKICARMLFFFPCVLQFYEGEFQCFVFESVKPASLFLPVLHMLLEAFLSQFMSIDVLLLLAVSSGRLRSV